MQCLSGSVVLCKGVGLENKMSLPVELGQKCIELE